MAGAKDAEVRKRARGTDVTGMVAVGEPLLVLLLLQLGLTRPGELQSPGLVTHPVANEIGITRVQQDTDTILEQWGHHVVEGLHPVALEHEAHVDLHVARLVLIDLDSKRSLDILLVQVVLDSVQNRVAESTVALALFADIVGVLLGHLVGGDHLLVAVGGGGQAAEDRVGIVASLDQVGAGWVRISHLVAGGIVQDRAVRVAAGHLGVVLVLDLGISETVANEEGGEVDVLDTWRTVQGGRHELVLSVDLLTNGRDVVTGVGLSSDVEVEALVLWELLEEDLEESIDILGGGEGVGDRVTVREANVGGLVQEDDGRVRGPRVGVEDSAGAILLDSAGAELHEETGQGRASWAAVEPEGQGVGLGFVAGLEEPEEEVLIGSNIKVSGVLGLVHDEEIKRIREVHN